MKTLISSNEVARKLDNSKSRYKERSVENKSAEAIKNNNIHTLAKSSPILLEGKKIKTSASKTKSTKPFVKWVGGKGQLIPEILAALPIEKSFTFTKFVEPFVGGGAVLFELLSHYKFEQIYISDLNEELINVYSVIKTDVEPLVNLLAQLEAEFISLDDENRKIYYYNKRELFNSLKLSGATKTEKASLFIFLNKTCFNGLYRVNKGGRFNVPIGAYKRPLICDRRNLLEVSAALQNVTICYGDYTLSKAFVDAHTLVYLDPPYRPLTGTSNFTSYTTSSFDDNEQVRLSKFVNDINLLGAKFILSNSDPTNTDAEDEFFHRLYGNYNICRVEANRMINSKSNSRGKIKELLICNYEVEKVNEERF